MGCYYPGPPLAGLTDHDAPQNFVIGWGGEGRGGEGRAGNRKGSFIFLGFGISFSAPSGTQPLGQS